MASPVSWDLVSDLLGCCFLSNFICSVVDGDGDAYGYGSELDSTPLLSIVRPACPTSKLASVWLKDGTVSCMCPLWLCSF